MPPPPPPLSFPRHRRTWMARRPLSAGMSAVLLMVAVASSVHAHTVITQPGAALLESAFPSASSESAQLSSQGIHPIQATIVSIVAPLYVQAAAAYTGVDTRFKPSLTLIPTNPAIRARFLTGVDDFAILTSSPTTAELAIVPGLRHYPIQGNAIVMPYNLPRSITLGLQLTITGLAMCRIMRANITRWNDPTLVALNPGMALTLAVDNSTGVPVGLPIVLLQMTNTYASALVWSTYCAKIDPVFKATIAPSTNPKLPWANFSAPAQFFPSSDACNAVMKDIPNSIAFMPYAAAVQYGHTSASFTNTRGEIVRPTADSATLNLFDLATDGYPTGTNSFDLTNPSTMQAWPMMSTSYLWLDIISTRTTCATKSVLAQFLLWLLQSDVVTAIATNLAVVNYPPMLVSQLRLLDRLQADLKCNGAPVISSDTVLSGVIGSSSLGSPLITLFSNFYVSIDTALTYDIKIMPENLAIKRVVTGEIQLALLNVAALTDKDTAMMQEAKAELMPAFITGVVPIFTLPTEITNLYATIAANKDAAAANPILAALLPLYPLVLDLDVTARIFLGNLTSWLDPDLAALNPQLPGWWSASGSPSTLLRVIVGATSAADPLSASSLLFQSILSSSVTQRPENAYAREAVAATIINSVGDRANPFEAIVAAHSSTMSMLDSEARLTLKTATVPGAVSYRMMSGMASDPTVEFAWRTHSNLAGASETVAASVASLQKCGAEHTAVSADGFDSLADAETAAIPALLDFATQRAWSDVRSPSPGCWPLSTLLSFGIATKLSSATDSGKGCDSALHALEFMHYMQSQDVLSAPANNFGLARLGDSTELIDLLVDNVFSRVYCDADSLIVVQPVVFAVPSSINSFGMGLGVVMLIVLAVSLLLVVNYRTNRALTHDSAIGFQIILLSGMLFMTFAMIEWTLEPTFVSCNSFLWLGCLGLTLLYDVQVASLWQAWRMATLPAAEAKRSHINKWFGLTLRAQAICLGLLVLDMLLLAIWQGASPLRPVELEHIISGTVHMVTSCNIDMESPKAKVGVAMLGILAAIKVATVMVGTLLALYGSMQVVSPDAHLSRRRAFIVSDTSRRMRRSIYTLLVSSVAIFGVLLIMSAIEGELLLLLQFFFVLNVAATWCLIFAPRFMSVLHLSANGSRSGDEEAGSLLNTGNSSLTGSMASGAHLSAAGLLAMSYAALQALVQSLQLQLQAASKELAKRKPITPKSRVDGGGSIARSYMGDDGGASMIHAEQAVLASPPPPPLPLSSVPPPPASSPTAAIGSSSISVALHQFAHAASSAPVSVQSSPHHHALSSTSSMKSSTPIQNNTCPAPLHAPSGGLGALRIRTHTAIMSSATPVTPAALSLAHL